MVLLLVEFVGYLFARNPTRWNDFRAFYAAGYLVRTQPRSLYDLGRQAAVQDALVSHNGVLMPFYHPSYEAALFAPFSLLPFHTAYCLFMALMVLCLVGSFYAMRPLFSTRIPWLQARPGLLLVCFVPTVASIAWGQDSLLFLLLLCMTLRKSQRGDQTLAGCFLGLALFRFQLAIPLAILLTVYRGRRFAWGFLSTAAAVIVLSISITRRSGTVLLGHLLANASLLHNQGAYAQQLMKVRPTFMANLTGLLYAMGTRFMAPHASFVVVLLASACLLTWTVLSIRRKADEDTILAMALLCTVLLSYHFLPYDLGILLPVFALLPKRVPPLALAALYWLPLVLFLALGGHALFLYSIPLLALLIYLSISRDPRPRGVEHMQA